MGGKDLYIAHLKCGLTVDTAWMWQIHFAVLQSRASGLTKQATIWTSPVVKEAAKPSSLVDRARRLLHKQKPDKTKGTA